MSRNQSQKAWFHPWFRLGFACCSDRRCGLTQAELLGFTLGFALVSLVALIGDVALPKQNCLVSLLVSLVALMGNVALLWLIIALAQVNSETMGELWLLRPWLLMAPGMAIYPHGRQH